MVVPKLSEATLLKRLAAPLADLSPLLAALLPHAGSTLLGSRIQRATLVARGEGGMTKKFD